MHVYRPQYSKHPHRIRIISRMNRIKKALNILVPLLMSVFVSFDKALFILFTLITGRRATLLHSGALFMPAAPATHTHTHTHWVHCGEECLLSWPELACESMSIIPSQWVLHSTAASVPHTRPPSSLSATPQERVTGMTQSVGRME